MAWPARESTPSTLIAEGRVAVGGRAATKPATGVDAGTPVVVRTDPDEPSWVSRGAHKLLGALEAFPVTVSGRRALDAGASTGGFTEVLLSRGAAEVVAVDVGYGELAWSLRTDERVRRARAHQRAHPDAGGHRRRRSTSSSPTCPSSRCGSSCPRSPPAPARTPTCCRWSSRSSRWAASGSGPGEWCATSGTAPTPCSRWPRSAASLGWGTAGVVASPLPGPAGNVEFFLWLRRDAAPPEEDDVRRAVEEGPRERLSDGQPRRRQPTPAARPAGTNEEDA